MTPRLRFIATFKTRLSRRRWKLAEKEIRKIDRRAELWPLSNPGSEPGMMLLRPNDGYENQAAEREMIAVVLNALGKVRLH